MIESALLWWLRRRGLDLHVARPTGFEWQLELFPIIYGARYMPGGMKLKAHVGRPCAYCGTTMTRPRGGSKNRPPPPTSITRDHILPRFKSGGRRPASDNRALVCYRCNADKADKALFHWLDELMAKRDPRATHVATFIERLVVHRGQA